MNKQEKANFLFEEMGGIDEFILKDCGEAFPAVRRKKKRNLRILVASVALLTALMITLSGICIANFVGSFSFHGDSKAEPPVEPSHFGGGTKVFTTSDVLLFDCELLFSGTPSLIYLDEEEILHAIKISSKDYSTVKQLSASPKRRVQSDDISAEPVWVSDGNGTVFTPYLENVVGNTYYGQIFDYHDEVIPNDKLSDLLDQLLPNP